MFNIALFLQKYSSIGLKEESIKKFLIESIKEATNVEITNEKIKFGKESVSLNVSGAEKTEIFMKREMINKTFLEKVNSAGFKISEKKII